MRKCLTVFLSIVLISGVLVSCSQNEKQKKVEKESDNSVKIGITFDTFVLERWIRDRDVFVATAQKNGAQVDVQNANGDVDKQKKQIEKFIEEKMDTIVIVPVDCYSLKEQVKKAKEHGIKVLSYDRMIQEETPDLYVTVDNKQVGKLMAQEIKKRLPDGGNIAMVCGPAADTNSQEVAHGFEDEMGEKQTWQIACKINIKSWAPENGFEAANEALADAENIDAVMCGNDGLAGYAIKALSEHQLAGKVVVVGQDADLEACQRVVEGTQSMTVYKPIEELAKIAAEDAVRLANGDTVEKLTGTMKNDVAEVPYCGLEPIAVTAENMDEIIIDSGFHLRDEVYLNVE